MTSIPENDSSSTLKLPSRTLATPDTNTPSSKSTITLQPNGVANPSRTIFDPWNSSTTGHQRAENRLAGSTSWRNHRNLKLRTQYRDGLGGLESVSDSVVAGNDKFGRDERKVNRAWKSGSDVLRNGGQRNIWENFRGRRHPVVEDEVEGERETLKEADCSDGRNHQGDNTQEQEQRKEENQGQNSKEDKAIFRNVCIYVNGSTAPLISDHKLKHLLAKHGATLSIALARRSVTHVIVGNAANKGGAGGGLAGSKIQREITRVKGKGIKIVTAEWVVESIKAGKRLNEAQFSNIRLVAPSGQNSVLGMFKSVKPRPSTIQNKKG